MSRIITAAELANRTDEELRVLFQMVQKALIRSERGTAERRNLLASLETISQEINRRRAKHWKLTPGP